MTKYFRNVWLWLYGFRWMWRRFTFSHELPFGGVTMRVGTDGYVQSRFSIEYKPGWGPWRFLPVYLFDYGTRVLTGGACVSWSRWWYDRRTKYGHAGFLTRLLNHLQENHGARAGGPLWGTEDTAGALVGGIVFWVLVAILVGRLGWLLIV